jgi:predicted CxxxxCH...CXXCH cytochrome family protein
MLGRKWTGRIFLGKARTNGDVKLAILMMLSVFFLFFIVAVDVQRTTAGDCDCGLCHGSTPPHAAGWQGCGTCHGFPPATGSHLTHFRDAGGVLGNYQPYGSTSIAQDSYPDPNTPAPSYMMGCGNCHPLDNAKHQNGVVDVEVYAATAPPDSLKAQNPASASFAPGSTVTTYTRGAYTFSYTNGTCSDVYCHSGNTVASSGPVGNPLPYPANPVPPGFKLNNGYTMDETCSSVTYAPYTVNYQRVYKTTPAWGTAGTFTTCTECHEFPLTTWGPAVQAGVGDSHQWYNNLEPWNYGHANNMDYFSGIPCSTCHNGTANYRGGSPPIYPLTADKVPTYWVQVGGKWIKAYYPVPLRNRALHVNGKPDVAFDAANGYRYYYDSPGYGSYNVLYSLTSAAYDPATKTCSNVSCHYNGDVKADPPLWQQKVKWGSPYRGWYGPGAECDQCHRMGYLRETCQ